MRVPISMLQSKMQKSHQISTKIPLEEQLAEYLYEERELFTDQQYKLGMQLCKLCYDLKGMVLKIKPENMSNKEWGDYKRFVRSKKIRYARRLTLLLLKFKQYRSVQARKLRSSHVN